MDLASLVLTALGLVFLLQIVIILQIKKINTILQTRQGKRSGPTSEKYPRKDRKPRENKKTVKQQVSNTPPKKHAQISSVDKSLRDINLRLKNAERDQEKARKKLSVKEKKDSERKTGREQGRNQNRSRGKDRDQNRNKDRDQSKNQNRGRDKDQNRNRDRVRKPIQRRNRDSDKDAKKNVPADAPGNQKPQSVLPPSPTREEVSPDSPITTPVINPEVKVPAPANSSFGQGAPIAVKRRNLESKPKEEKPEVAASEIKPKEDVSVEKPTKVNETVVPEFKAPEDKPREEVAAEQPPVVKENPVPEGQEVSFGRR